MRSLVLPLTVWLACVPSPRRTAPETTYAQPAVATQAHPYPQGQSRQHPPHASPQPVRRGAPPPALTPSPQPAPATVTSVSGCSPNGLEVIRLINAHRARHGLAAIPASPSLCTVAATHVSDLAQNQPSGGECNLHSWSNAGPWGACCYTSNHAQARCMWNKPRELTVYPGRGYENAHRGRGDSPAEVVTSWARSQHHNATMLNQGVWRRMRWRAIGAESRDGFAVVWFGEQTDPAAR